MVVAARRRRRGLRHRRLPRRPAGPAHLVRRDGRHRRYRGARAVARLGLRDRQGRLNSPCSRAGRSVGRIAQPASRELRPSPEHGHSRTITCPKFSSATKWTPRPPQIFRERGVEVDEITGKTPDELIAIIGQYDGLAIRSSTKVTKDILAAATNLKVVGRAGIGVDNVDIPAASAQGVVVMNTPFGNSITTAEHAIALMFALARQLPEADASTQAGKWEKNRFMGVELTAKTLGLIGAGNIGSIVADRARGPADEGRRLRSVPDPRTRGRNGRREGRSRHAARPRRLHHAAHAADRPDPQHPVGGKSRQDQEGRAHHQLRARRADRRGGAEGRARFGPHRRRRARRVRRPSPRKESPLFGTPGFVSTPHLGASTTEAQVNVAIQVAEQMADFLVSGGVTNALNMPSLSAEEAPKLKPYMALAEKLGSLVGQLAHRRAQRDRGRGRGRRRRAQPEADHRRGARRACSGSIRTRSTWSTRLIWRKERGLDVREVRQRARGRLSHAACA